jgi:hypothetical protein
MITRLLATLGLVLCSAITSSSTQAFQLAVSQYGRVTASLRHGKGHSENRLRPPACHFG